MGMLAEGTLSDLSHDDIFDSIAALKITNLPLARRLERAAQGLAFAPDPIDFSAGDPAIADPTRDGAAQRIVGSVIGMSLSRADAVARNVTSGLVYLGPFRQPPERLVLLTGEQ